ncbi:terminase large subunit domain-containing protein [Sphingomonas lenta]|uniref:ATP-binding protein n=1 Tax=Sphingomonas lenta TaxID=1141887 RepID=A0A2A2SBI1_9SPHN|nr:terminase family protein [Sphingomonas lenta]PAX06540.1 ATP-binding protein [Sphingomonas lenta]
MLEYLSRLAAMPPEKQAIALGSLPEPMLHSWRRHFPDWAHEGQRPLHDDWRTWVIMGGRGFGKTRAGAEWVLEQVRASTRPASAAPMFDGAGVGRAASAEWTIDGEGRARRGSKSRVVGRGCGPAGRVAPTGSTLRVALVGATVDDAKAVMVEGPSGLLSLAGAGEIERWLPAERRLVFANGAEAALFSGRSPQGLRGPEHDLAWCDELGKWRHAQATWDMLQLGLRRGDRPRAVVTTTPSAEPALRRVMEAAGTHVTGGATGANRHLAPGFVEAVERAYGGTRLGVQEIEGRLVADREGSLWPFDLIEACRRSGPSTAFGGPPPRDKLGEDFSRVVVGVDPPASAAGTCGIVAAGLDRDGRALVLADLSVAGRSPEGWARAVADAAAAWGADRVVVEANQGGEMVRTVLRAASLNLPLELVHASRGKAARAEPVAALFESGRAGLAGRFPELEAQLGQFTAGGYEGEGSPDRADAMVWALWALMLKRRVEPGVRKI